MKYIIAGAPNSFSYCQFEVVVSRVIRWKIKRVLVLLFVDAVAQTIEPPAARASGLNPQPTCLNNPLPTNRSGQVPVGKSRKSRCQ